MQTTIARERERLEYEARRKAERLQELLALEVDLKQTEEGVLLAMFNLRPSTGRIPWPKALPSFKKHEDEFDAEMRRINREFARRDAQADAWLKAQEARDEKRMEAQRTKDEAELKAMLDKLTPEERQREIDFVARLKAAVDAGEFTFGEFLSALSVT